MKFQSFFDFFKYYNKYLFSVILISIIFGLFAGIFAEVFIEKEYISEAQLIINRNKSKDFQMLDIQSDIMLINTFSDILIAEPVLDEVHLRLGSKYSSKDIANSINISQSSNSQIFYISATLPSPTDAREVVETLVTVFIDQLDIIYSENFSGIYLLSSATFNPDPIWPNKNRAVFIGVIIGLFTGSILSFIYESSKDRVEGDDALRELGFNKLGEVFEMTKREKKKSRKALLKKH